MRFFVIPCAALFVTLASLAPTQAAVQVVIDKAAQSMTVSVDGKRRYSWPVSTGMKGYSTPVGSFQPFRTEEEHYSKEWDDAPMPHSIFFTREGHAIHGSYATRRLGSPASHGCVRLAPAKAATLFSLVRSHGLNNTRIVVSGRGSVTTSARSVRRASETVSDRPRYAPRRSLSYFEPIRDYSPRGLGW